MRAITRIFGIILTFTTAAAAQEAKPLKAGATIPGPFQTLMVTGDRAGNFHCPVCEYDLRPAVLVFVRDVDDAGPAVIDFLKKLDALIAKHPSARISACAVFVNDGGYRQLIQSQIDNAAKVADLELTRAVLAKEDKEAKIKDLAKKASLKNVTLGLGSPNELAKYDLGKDAEVTVLVYNRQQVVGVEAFPKDKLTEEGSAKILKEVEAVADKVEKATARR